MHHRAIALAATLLSLLPPGSRAQQRLSVKPGAFTIEQALQQSRLNRLHGGEDGTVIELQEGVYRLTQPVVLRPEDSHTTIVARGNVLISGGVEISGWRKKGRAWVADVPLWNGRPLEFRQLWVNGRKAVRARNVPVAKADGGDPFELMPRILSMDKATETIYVPRKAVQRLMPMTQKAWPAEMVLHEMWCVAVLRIKEMRAQGDSVAVTFHNPESHVHFMHPWPSPMVTPDGRHNSAFYLTNDSRLLDEPGEWHLDADARQLYYIPLPGEDMRTAHVVAPALETLLTVQGTPERPVTDVTLEGIAFEHSTWMRPSTHGHAPLQAGMYMTEAYKIRPQIRRPNGDHGLDNQGWVGRPPAAVTLTCAERFTLSACTFSHTASTALDCGEYTAAGTVERCRFTDIGGTAIMAGSFGGEAHEAHLPYDPLDRRATCRAITIADNRIDDAANEDWGAIGIAAGYVRDISIVNNEVANVSYTGISLGWGWNQQTCAMANNTVRANYIHHYARHMYDTAGIYTLGAQPHTFIEQNVVDSICTPSYVHDPNHWFYLYTDEGSSYITVRDNWTPAEKYLQNSNGPGCTWADNGPAVSDSIRRNAGIRKTATN
jgi:hypothetical protein